MDESDWADLKRAALEARTNAYAPYSGFTVGAAILSETGRVFAGVNIAVAGHQCFHPGAGSSLHVALGVADVNAVAWFHAHHLRGV